MEVFVSRNGLDNGWRAYQPKSGDSDGEISSHRGCRNNDEFVYSGSRTTWPDDEERPMQLCAIGQPTYLLHDTRRVGASFVRIKT